ncbi:hypothetical protein C5167_018013 [Papaver somniferum]|uniref:Uncharacterized protein n=1 Tax=Papaver somniferum TaxID=3469 RepID=A0A4Y7ILJ4_PAPSO|nr:hypothetical protein C5167_018013 [Papaver somniferum]
MGLHQLQATRVKMKLTMGVTEIGGCRFHFEFAFITAMTDGPKHIETTLTSTIFEELCSDLLDRYVERMVKEAERYAGEDKEKRDGIDTKNQADSVIYEAEKSGGSTQAIKDGMTALNQEVMQLGQSLYNQPGAAPGCNEVVGSPGAGAAELARDLRLMPTSLIANEELV